MYEIFIYDHKTSYCFYDNEINPSKYPQIEPGSHVFIPDLNLMYFVLKPGKWIVLAEDGGNEDLATTATLGEAVLGNMILGE